MLELEKIENSVKQPFFNVSRTEQIALKSLSENRTFETKPADKGGGIVIWGIEQYKKEALRQLENTHNYREVQINPQQGIIEEIQSLVTHAKEEQWITHKEYDFLIQKDPQIPMFYLLPKIHKNIEEPPGRPIVSGIGSVLEPLSKFADFFLRKYVLQMTSYVQDTMHIITQVEGLCHNIECDFLITMDIENLYTSIPQLESLRVLATILKERDPQARVPTDFILECTRIALMKNFFAYDQRFFLQIKGTSMGATFAPNIANLYVDSFEREVIFTNTNPFHDNIVLWKRYIDDILIQFRGTVDTVESFHRWINGQNEHLRFTIEMSREEINFLDITIFAQDGVLCTKLYSKPTEKNTLLHYSSFHPRNLRDNLPYGQFLRVRRNCTQRNDYEKYSKILTEKLKCRGYPARLLRRAKKRAWYNNREALLSPKAKKTDEGRLVFVNTYSPISNSLKQAIVKNWHIANAGSTRIELPLFAYKRNANLRQKLVRTFREPVNTQPSISESWGFPKLVGHYPCGSCTSCEFTKHTTEFKFGTRKRILNSHTNCNSSNVVYVITCPCDLQYIGYTTRKIRVRIGEHRSCIRCHTKGAPLVAHYMEMAHSENDLKWSIIQQISGSIRGGNVVKRLHKQEQYWIFTVNTVEHGLNECIEWQSLIMSG